MRSELAQFITLTFLVFCLKREAVKRYTLRDYCACNRDRAARRYAITGLN